MKVAGIGAIFSAFFLLFLTLTGNKKAEINCLAELCTGFALIRAELGTRLTPMPELLSLLTERCQGPAGGFFRTVDSALPLLAEKDFSALWNAAAEEHLGCLGQRELETVKKAGAVLGKYELSEQISVVSSCLEELRGAEEKGRADYPQCRRLLFGVNAAAGGFIIILLL